MSEQATKTYIDISNKDICLFCKNQSTEHCRACKNSSEFQKKCCANCVRYLRGRCLAIEDGAYTHTGVATICLKDPTDYCSDGEPEEE